MVVLKPEKAERYLKSVERFAMHFDKDCQHFTTVALLSSQLFDGFYTLHRLTETDKMVLRFAAMLHDIGAAYGSRAHNKKSYTMILSSPQLEFDKKTRLIIGLIARYHRKTLPHESHDGYSLLKKNEQLYVCQLAALLRIADGLDVSHCSRVKTLTCSYTDSEAIIVVNTHDADAERSKALEKADLFERVFSRHCMIRSI